MQRVCDTGAFLLAGVLVTLACWQVSAPAALEAFDRPGASDPAWAALGKPCSPDASAPSLPDAQRDSLPPAGHWTVDEKWAEIARQVPGGFAGYYLEPSPKPAGADRPASWQRAVIRLVHPERRDEAVRALEPLLKAMYGDEWVDLSDALVVSARWNWAQLFDWYRYLDARLDRADLKFSDIQETHNRIEYGVPDAAARVRFERQLAALGAPCFLIAVEIAEPVMPLQGCQ